MLLQEASISVIEKILKFWTQSWLQKLPRQNSADQDQTASVEAVWSMSSLFSILTWILWIPALIKNILFEKWHLLSVILFGHF